MKLIPCISGWMLLGVLSGPCGEETVSAAFMYLSFTIRETKGDAYINSLHWVTSTWECIALAHTGKGNTLLPCLCKTVFPKGTVNLFWDSSLWSKDHVVLCLLNLLSSQRKRKPSGCWTTWIPPQAAGQDGKAYKIAPGQLEGERSNHLKLNSDPSSPSL